jgi:glutathione S-transferase
MAAVLYDMPVSNHGARVRFVMYKKKLESMIEIRPPSTLGGLKSPEYLALNPQGKMPLLSDGQLNLPESEVIVQYLLDKYSSMGPPLVAPTPEGRANAALVTRIHDLYIAPVQGSMYRSFASAEQRANELKTLNFQLDVIEQSMAPLSLGPFVAGPEITAADGALFPTLLFCDFILPTYFKWTGLWSTRPRLLAWWKAVNEDPEAKKVLEEVKGGLEGWASSDRWNTQGINQQMADSPDLTWSY